MMLVFSIVVLLISAWTCTSSTSQCSDLNLIPSKSKSNDENYSIETEIFNSSYVIKISLTMKQRISDTSWFIMGATNSSQLIGLWEPVSSADGQVIDCSSSSAQAVMNPNSILENSNRLRFNFYWMAPSTFNNTVVFIATIYEGNRTNSGLFSRSIQSDLVQIEPKYGQVRVRDVDPAFCTSSPCQNGGTCIGDPRYSFCQCTTPWNGVFCNLQYYHILLASNLTFTTDYYINSLNSPAYQSLTTDVTNWLNNAFSVLPGSKTYSINFVAPSPTGSYISISVALTPTTLSYVQFILSALATALSRNPVTTLGRQLSIDPSLVSNAVTQDSAPYTSCIFPFAFVLVDYSFCIPLESSFVCSRSRVIDRNTTFNSLDCSRNIFNYIPRNPCFPNICLNGGSCTLVNGIATCICPGFYTGSRCEQLFGCNPVTNAQAITCVNQGTCVGSTCVCSSNTTTGTLCEIPTNTGCDFPFTYMGVTYSSCAVINGQSMCLARNSGTNGNFPHTFLVCGGPQCQNNLCGSRGSCINTPNGFFRCINCVLGYSGYFCELQYRTVQLNLNVTYTPDFQNASSNASQQLQALINQILTTSLFNITIGGFRPDFISFVPNLDGTTSATLNINTNYLNFLNNATQGALDRIGAITVVVVNTTRACAPSYIYGGQNITGCVLNQFNVPICSLTDNFDRDGQFQICSEPINLNLCNGIDCGVGQCFVTSRNATFCRCASGVTGPRCDQLIQCSDVNCLNNGTCVRLSTGFFRCNCPPGYGGGYCQFNTTGCVFPFVDNQNQTRNTCISTPDFFGGTVPWCRNALGQPRSCQIDYCAQRPCVFGICIPTNRWAFGNSYPSFICNCTVGFTGRLCTHAYFRLKTLYAVPNISIATLNALESPTTQTYQNVSSLFRNLVRNRTNSTFDFLPLIFTTFRTPNGNFYQITADMSFPGNISANEIANLVTPILSNLPPQFNATYINNGLLDPEEIQPLNPAPNCTLPYEYNTQGLAVCHMDANGLAYCAYGLNYTLVDRKLCDASGLPTAQYTACDLLNITNPCNGTRDFPIRCIAADDGWNCFCEETQTLGKDCANLDYCRNGSLLCRNNASCVNRPDLADFACNCTFPYYGRLCENFGLGYRFFLVNYSNETSPGLPTLISIFNQTIINITNGSVIATSIIINPSGDVTVTVVGTNYSVPQLQGPLINLINNNWTVGPFLVRFNQTNLIPIETNATCFFPFSYKGVTYTECILTDFNFPWCSRTPIFNGSLLDCRGINWCASGPCLNNGTCIVNQQLGRYQCICPDGWSGVQCAYRTTTITIIVPLGNNTYNNFTLPLFPNGTIIDVVRPGPNNTVIIVIIVNGTNVPNISLPNILNITVQPTPNINGCVFPFIYNNSTHFSCIPIGNTRATYCCQNPNCDINPQWQFCNSSNICTNCAPNAGCTINQLGVVSCICPPGFTGILCDIPLNLCALNNRSCLNNGVCVVNPITLAYFCNCTAVYGGARCETFLPCLSNPCVNNGTCSASPSGTVLCNCTNCYGGPFCQTIDYCCLNVCGANGICIPGPNSTYLCICQPNYVGVNCSIFNPCAVLPCLNNGTCIVTNTSSFQCICPVGFTGPNCALIVNPCASSPCVNNGQCVSLGNQFICICPLGFNGTFCETPINPCGSNPCVNNGVCLQQVLNSTSSVSGSFLGFFCVCNATLFTGVRCEIPISPCPTNPAIPSPCRNGGSCVPTANGQGFSCFCLYPYTGSFCEAIIDPCQPNPCGPFGQCFTNSATFNFTCLCVNATFTGPLCQNLTNPCVSSPCTVGSTCIPLGSGFICQCPPNRTGLFCESILPPCTSFSCFNNGTCLYSGSTVLCVCPPPFTGPQCLQRIDICTPSPCLNNGTCFSQPGNRFICLCSTLWTGPLCETLINPCITYPCFFGGTCVLNSTFQPICVCPPGYTGIYCQTALSPCLSGPCLNNGTCITNAAQIAYTCQCPPLYTGLRCENLINPCLANPCIFGTCFVLSNGTYYCACIANYTGLICDHPIDQCTLRPCVNNASCIGIGTSYICTCPPGYTGRFCEQIINPCLSTPCRTGTCLTRGTGYICACDASYTGLLCETLLNPCLSNPCVNNQTCLPDATNTGYICLCAPPYTGLRCASIILPCTTVICLNGGTCFQPTLTTTQCLCPDGFSGTFCEAPVDRCRSRPCVNNGSCLSTSTNTFICICLPGYTGVFCEQYNPCLNFNCFNGGTCAIAPSAIGGRICVCPPGFTDALCSTPISPCASSPCVNNGICLATLGTNSFVCRCPATYTGVFCETYINPCLSYLCGNGGTCFRTTDGTPICVCPPSFTGIQCLTQLNPCLSSPCLNNGQCLSLLPTYNYSCVCPANYTGYRCENFIGPCTTWLCQNGGSCVINGLNLVSCICPPPWTGTLCTQRIDPCATANPCLNSGICIATYNGTNQAVILCQCLAAFTGRFCEIPVSPCQSLPCINGQCLLRADGSALCFCNPQWTGAACDSLISPCNSQPCLNNGVCFPLGLNYTCICPQGYSGVRCEIVPPILCVLTCANNGTCAIRGTDNTQICVCPRGYTGTRCEIQISPCIPTPCLNNGICLPSTFANGTIGFICVCSPPYTGPLCANYIPITCGNITCLNGGVCLLAGNRTICQCPSLFTGTRCEFLINPCDSQPCVNGGACQTILIGRKKRQQPTPISTNTGYFCQCPPFYTGARCESFIILCGSNPCQNNGTCYQDGTSNTIRCVCPPNFTGIFCNIPFNGSNICAANPSICFNGGTCRPNASLSQGFSCDCTAITTGAYCEQPLDQCQLNPRLCLNNGTCIPTLAGYACLCPPGFTGVICSTSTNPCSSQPCVNNGSCIVNGNRSYTCICPAGYSGSRCEICNCPCHLYPCVNGGVCRSTPTGGVACACLPGYTGVRCEISLLPCDSNPCMNGGICLYNPDTLSFTCQCCLPATGRFCEILINPCNNTIPYCFNGGTCVLNANTRPTCFCPSGFTGTYCETYSNPCGSVNCIQGNCVVLANSSFLCICPIGRSGRFCEIIDQCAIVPGTIPPCRNGGTCIRLSGTSYICMCLPGFTGTYCDISNPCSSMPCAPNATCAPLLNGTAVCLCPPGVMGPRCNQTITSLFCSSSPCRNNGTCVDTMCICPNNTSGPTCNITRTPCPTSSQPGLACANGGTCVPGLGCFCQPGFGGDDCETLLPTDCTNVNCLNGGTCLVLINGTVVCRCSAGFTGARCENATSLCLPNPCQNNGTCIPSGTSGYICLCPPNLTGPQCGLVTNACLYSPCVNNGTCLPLINGGYSCFCPPAFTGAQCQIVLNSCSSAPCNTGTCVPINNGLAFICNCPPQLTGPTCLIANPCGLRPCLNGGTCVPTAFGSYICQCPPNYMGTNCQTLNLCIPNPCLNSGTCTMLSSNTISCACLPAYMGDRCQTLNPCRNPICVQGLCQINPITQGAQCACYAGWTGTFCDTYIACSSNPCVYGTCVPSGTSGYICNCLPGYYGPQCQFPIVQTPCQSNPCRNGGTCQLTSTNGYVCSCPASFVGTNCEFINPCLLIGASPSCQPVLTPFGNYTCSCPTNPCASNPCQYGTCTVTNGGQAYSCQCYPSYLGARCDLPNPCSYIVCYNGGTCLATVNSDGTAVIQSCQCPPSGHFVGTYCEHYNPCISIPCLNGASCTYYINITCFYRCQCPPTFTGERCQNTLSQIRCETFGIPNNCRNGGTCFLVGTTTQCYCTSFYTGALCESPINMCNLQVCQNGGTCTVFNSTDVSCRCLPGFQGKYCEYSTDPCSVRPCLNGGQCIASGITFACNCAQTVYTGPRCETLLSSPCVPNPCANGGTCRIAGTTYVCLCPSSFTGLTCLQSLNLCSTIQCLNGGNCINYGTFATCSCLTAYTGDRCQFINQCFPLSPCLFGGTCIAVLNSYSCQCPPGRTGATCQLFADSPCGSGFRCANGGTCIVLSGTATASCRCTASYTGQNCEQVLTAAVQTTSTTLSSSVLTIVSQSSSSIAMVGTTSSLVFNITNAPYTCDDISLACLAYSAYCAREIEFAGIPCRVLCPRTCNTCCEDFYTDGTCSLANCQRNPRSEIYCRKSCICKI